MAAASGRTLLCVCSVVVAFLLLQVDGTTAAQGTLDSVGLVGESTKEFYLRGNRVVPSTEVNSTEELAEESFESFARRELVDSGYGGDPADANCDTNRTNCP